MTVLAALGVVLGCASCDGGTGSSAAEQATAVGVAGTAPDVDIVARVADLEISRSAIEAPIQLQLHDLSMQRFRLLRQSLLSATLGAIETAPDTFPVVRLALQPPLPPRLAVDVDPARVRPPGAAPVTVLSFCNFESPHCARLQITLSRISAIYSDVVRFASRDLALPFHRNAAPAAEAARCALEQGNYWRFHDILYAGSGPLDGERLERAARAALLDGDAFAACVSEGRRRADVAADLAEASMLGIASVPTVFVNGLYASPDIEAAELIWLIELELARLGLPSPRVGIPARRITAGVALLALLPSEHPGHGFALLSASGGPAEVFGEGAAIPPSLIVERITEAGVVLRNGRSREWLDLAVRDADEASGDPATPPAASNDDERSVVTPHRAVPITLDRNEVLVRLSDRAGLQNSLVPVPMTSGGYRQLRITEVPPGSLYELLGLQPGDVILGVNEQPVHEADNPLWRALETENEVRVRVMRRGGVAQHYTYQFED